MEGFLEFFILNDSIVVSALVAVIAIILLLLLVMGFRNPEGVVLNEMGSSDAANGDIENTLRKVLGEQRWVSRSASAAPAGDGAEASGDEEVGRLEEELLGKDKQIADLNKQLTQGGGGSAQDDSELLEKIKSLQDRLKEYEIIEDDIADLSLYKSENQKLKDELAQLQAAAESSTTVVEEAPEPVGETHIPESEEKQEDGWDVEAESAAPSGKDLVAEFEKVVNNQEASAEDEDYGNVDMSAESKERMENVQPDSKEEAEVLIEDLKLLKREKKE